MTNELGIKLAFDKARELNCTHYLEYRVNIKDEKPFAIYFVKDGVELLYTICDLARFSPFDMVENGREWDAYFFKLKNYKKFEL